MSDHRVESGDSRASSADRARQKSASDREDAGDPIALLDECLASCADNDPRRPLLYKLRHAVMQGTVQLGAKQAECQKLQAVVEKLTAPANRIGTLLALVGDGLARVAVGGAEYYTNVDPRVPAAELQVGAQVLVNEAFAVIRTIGVDRNGPVMRVAEAMPDGRVRFESEPGRQALIVLRSSEMVDVTLKPGDEVRVDPSHRFAIEKMVARSDRQHVLDETPTVTWEQIGGQREAIAAIRKAIEYPLLHADTLARYRFSQPKGFLLYGPPGCGKTLIGQATAASLAKLVADAPATDAKGPPITTGAFLHIKGPEILSMWLGESERIVRELFAKARARRAEGALPFIFIDEAESILGTRRAMRSFNITNTLVPMFCTEMDGIESLRDVVIVLASNRPDLIDPAVLRPGRIDRKIKVNRPDRAAAADILKVYLTADLPYAQGGNDERSSDAVRAQLAERVADALFRRVDQYRVLGVRLRNGQTKTLYRGDLISGAILASIVQRAKERAIDRVLQASDAAAGVSADSAVGGITDQDLLLAADTEFTEGEVLPPDDSAEEWLKLLDHHPEQVVGVSSYRGGRLHAERPVGHIV
ncbi:MAG: AAA family ATPase [Nitrospiraceae bacterium]